MNGSRDRGADADALRGQAEQNRAHRQHADDYPWEPIRSASVAARSIGGLSHWREHPHMPIMRNAPTPRGANPRQVTAAVILRLPTPRHDVLLSSAAVGGYAIERDRGLLPGKRDEGAARFPVTVGVGDRIRSTT